METCTGGKECSDLWAGVSPVSLLSFGLASAPYWACQVSALRRG